MQLFHTLRKKARIECTCGKKDIVTGLFHDTGCPYLKTFIEAHPDPYEHLGMEAYTEGRTSIREGEK